MYDLYFMFCIIITTFVHLAHEHVFDADCARPEYLEDFSETFSVEGL